jgi:hypothetical protein
MVVFGGVLGGLMSMHLMLFDAFIGWKPTVISCLLATLIAFLELLGAMLLVGRIGKRRH